MADKKLVKVVRYSQLHKLLAAIALLTFFVIMIAGLAARASFMTITFRACIAMFVVKLISVVVMRVIASYEEMNGGQA